MASSSAVVSEFDVLGLSVYIIQTARQLLESVNPAYDRAYSEYYSLLAKKKVKAKRQARGPRHDR